MSVPVSQSRGVQRQIVLPTSKAVEIAYKSIRLRLSRSLLVTSGIVLALAFLMSIRTTQALLDGMRGWEQDKNAQRAALANQITEKAQTVRDTVAAGATGDANVPASNAMDLSALQKELGPLPVAVNLLGPALIKNQPAIDAMNQWIAATRDFNSHRSVYSDAQGLEQLMASKGVPTTPEDILADRIQTRWLLGLALMVAFVGILNAMLMSVTERFREIGTMKCLGALDSFIIKLFLIESLFQGIVGTIVGIFLGLLLSFVSAIGAYDGYVWKNLPLGGIFSSALVCLIVGVGLTVGGAVYPAWQAARMQPIEAMRVET